jgi:hypothetical protein
MERKLPHAEIFLESRNHPDESAFARASTNHLPKLFGASTYFTLSQEELSGAVPCTLDFGKNVPRVRGANERASIFIESRATRTPVPSPSTSLRLSQQLG